ncbi:heterogeneous nuclear ribonucleoprotein 1-like [Phragmites australis]|uniref:heterogeneous nuclear ribonucleoprotein 1-like n=1 Tax=Phragmites australis TaxID=29695 RepID=UPI002D771359|nr:heterogeneous nuclear ribonucleoprotein 1-like [Phragmites australis]
MAAAPEGGAEEVGESRKLFVGGIPASAQEAELRAHFGRFGEVRSVIVMRDRETGHGRGFGFVEFEEEAAAASALGDGVRPRHFICGRLVDVKRARTRQPRDQGEQHFQHQQVEQGQGQGHQDNQPATGNGSVDSGNVNYDSKKVFIGGLRDNITEEEFRAYFETFGTVTDAVVIYDSLTSRSRGFGFVTFDSEEAVGKVMQQSFHNLNGTKVEAKIAIPKDEQYYRNSRGRGGRPFGGRDPVVYEGVTYQPYNARYSLYNGYMPQPVPTQPYFPGPYFAMGGYPYGNGYPNQGVMSNVPGMMARRVPPAYGTYPQMYPGFNFVYRAGYGGADTSFQHGINGGSDNVKGQTTVDIQEVDSTASVATKFELMKLGSQ